MIQGVYKVSVAKCLALFQADPEGMVKAGLAKGQGNEPFQEYCVNEPEYLFVASTESLLQELIRKCFPNGYCSNIAHFLWWKYIHRNMVHEKQGH